MTDSAFAQIQGMRVALLTNHAGRTASGDATLDVFADQKKYIGREVCSFVGVFTPEHGYYTSVPAGELVDDGTIDGIPVFSLYGRERSPRRQDLEKFDALVIDIQDIGIRSYTYISTVFYAIRACAENGKKVFVLDRPNPIGGMVVDGNVIDAGRESFVSIIPTPYIHGCTVGELAMMMNDEGWLGARCDLTVIRMQGWQRWMAWEDTDLMWLPTSPHIPTPDAVRGAAMLGIFGELGIISIGIGTTSPFQYIGSPQFDIEAVDRALLIEDFFGVKLIESRFRPFYGMYSGSDCTGWLLRFPLSNHFRPYTTGIRLMLGIRKVHPELFNGAKISDRGKEMFRKVTGTDAILDGFLNRRSDEDILRAARKGLNEFLDIRAKYLLY
ncbi:MAG: DUF1343 domain-containing protein [Bacteroidota bacterium]